MHEHKHAEPAHFVPERLDRWIVDPFAVELRGDGHALETELVPAAIELLERSRAAKRMGVRGADETAGIIALGLFGLVVDEPRRLKIGAHARRAGQPGGVNAGDI